MPGPPGQAGLHNETMDSICNSMEPRERIAASAQGVQDNTYDKVAQGMTGFHAIYGYGTWTGWTCTTTTRPVCWSCAAEKTKLDLRSAS